MDYKIKTQVHTIIMLIGPSGSGKTTFAKEVLIPNLDKGMDKKTGFKPNVQYISSDEIRQDITGYDHDKESNVMMEVSEPAFDVLWQKLDTVTRYPVNSEFVILDTTGLNADFRNQVKDIARKNHYNVDAIVFDYKGVDEYKKDFNGQDNGKSGKTISKQIKRLKQETFKDLKKRDYKNIKRIKDKSWYNEVAESFAGVEIDVYNYKQYKERFLDSGFEWVVISDVHGCIDELKELIQKYDFEIKNNVIYDTDESKKFGLLFIGDLIDKHSEENIKDTIDFIHKNMERFDSNRFKMILGNHEEMVWKWLVNHKDLIVNEEKIKQKEMYYNTAVICEKDPELKEKFLDIFDAMKGWYKQIGFNKRSFIATHAPCDKKFLEKMDMFSLKHQYKSPSRSKNKEKTNDELTPFLMEDAVNNQPVHIFGHLGQTNLRKFKNKICIDAGCVYGHKLLGVCVNNNKPFVQSVGFKGDNPPAKNHFGSELFSEVKEERKNVNIDDLSEPNKRRLDYIVENGIEYIGGTISPSDKDTESGELESLKTAFDYYKGKSDKIILQPKYMGSRAQLYLNIDLEKCYATSRNGYKIRFDISNAIEKYHKEYFHLFKEFDAEEIVLDTELLPWSVLGKGLIESQFKTTDACLEKELNFLKRNGFEEEFETLKREYQESGYLEKSFNQSKKALSKEFGHKHNVYKNIQPEIDRMVEIDKQKEMHKIFHQQVEFFGDESVPMEFKPFRILKIKKVAGDILVPNDMSNIEQFQKINSDEFCIVDFNKKEDFEKAEKWYENLTKTQMMEGCVVKPETIYPEAHFAQFLKVRNPNYLTIIYGYDMYFEKKYKKLFNQKNINKKIRSSIVEFKLGEKMLQTDPKSGDFKQIVANILFENEKEKEIDPRL